MVGIEISVAVPSSLINIFLFSLFLLTIIATFAPAFYALLVFCTNVQFPLRIRLSIAF